VSAVPTTALRIVLALGGNALLRRDQAMTPANQLANVRRAATQVALVARGNELLLTHGNGPQVGLLALQASAYTAVPAYPLDVLGAETDGMLGYLLEQELSNRLPSRAVATLITRVEVRLTDPAFDAPSKPIGPVYAAADAERVAIRHGWTMAADGTGMRRVVPSPAPMRVMNLQSIRWLLSHGVLVIAGGGGGVPVAMQPAAADEPSGTPPSLQGVEAVVDKDATSALLARDLQADVLLIATDVPALYADWSLPTQRPVLTATPAELSSMNFATGSMGPKVQAACDFVRATGKRAVIGSLDDIQAMLQGTAGTQISL